MTTTLAFASLVLVLAAAIVLVRLHTLPTGVDPRREAVSDYGATRFHRHYRAMVVLLGLGAACLALALHRSGDVRAAGLVWLWVFAAARVLIAGFMTVRAGRRPTLASQAHLVLAAIAFTAIAFAAPTISNDLDLDHTLATLVAVTAVATLVAYAVRPFVAAFGVVERLLYLAFIAWLIAVASSVAS